MGFGPPARNRKKIAPEIGPEIGPAEKIEKKWGKIRIFRVLSYFFPIFSAGPILGPISGAIFFLFWAGGPKPIFYQKPRFSKIVKPQVLRKAPDALNFLRCAMRAILSVRPKCSHRCVSLKETSLKPVQILKHTTKNSAEQTSMRTKWFKHIAI